MSDSTNTAGAPVSEYTSVSGAADALAAALTDDDLTFGQPDQNDEDGDDQRAAAESPDTDEAGDPPDAETEDDSEGDAEPEDDESEGEEDPKTDDEPKVRLRDGTEVPIAELKKAYGAQREFEQQKSQWEQKQAQLAQQEQFFQQVLPTIVAAMERQIPAEPDPSLLQSDPIAHYEQTMARQKAIGELQNLQAAQTAEYQRHQQQQTQSMRAYVEREKQALIEKIPEAADPAKRAELGKVFFETAQAYGFTDEEVNQTFDHRLVLLARDAAAYRKLQAQKPAVEKKVQNAAPVSKPGKRKSASEQSAQARSERMARLRETGSIDDAAALIADTFL
jgi:hypothetical protein